MTTSMRWAIVMVVATMAVGALVRDALHQRTRTHTQIVAEQKTALTEKAAAVEGALRTIYQGGRTISLLPSVRALKGGNRPKGAIEDGSTVDRTRFAPDAQQTVQQIYNNLASNVSVSEVYAILDGFRPDAGETPFFMYDEVRVGGLADANAEHEDEEAEDADDPEESEDAEYSYYVELLRTLRTSQPALDLDHTALERIPAFTSPMFRTCDNAQYTSISQGDVHDAEGVAISVPIYAHDTHLVGVISVIVRSDVLEAQLRGQPYLLITEEDRARAASEGWTEPSTARFALRNVDRGFEVADRRFGLAAARVEPGAVHLRQPLKVPMAERWELELHVPVALLTARDRAIWSDLALRIAVVVALGALVIAWVIAGERKRTRLAHAAATAEAQRQHLVDAVAGIVQSSSELRKSAAHASDASHSLAAGSQRQAASLEETSAAIEEIAATSRTNANTAGSAKSLAAEAREAAERGASRVDELVAAMAAVEESSREISRISRASHEIALQTHMLALNATVEAARAGESGAGFAVIAEEIRKLSHSSSEAAKETAALIARAVEASRGGVALTDQVRATLSDIVERVQSADALIAQIAAASGEQASSVGQCNIAVAEADRETQAAAATATQVAQASAEVTAHARDLLRLAESLVREPASAASSRTPAVSSALQHPDGSALAPRETPMSPPVRRREAAASSRDADVQI